jgi:hypothetical protein
MKNRSLLTPLLAVLYVFTSCTVTKNSYQPAESGKSASSYSHKEKIDYLNRYGLKDYHAKFGY